MKTLKDMRIGMGLSQLKLAHYLGVSRSLIYFVEKGQRSLPTRALIKYAQLEMKFKELSESIPVSADAIVLEQKEKRAQVQKCMRNKRLLETRKKGLQIRLEKKRRAYRKCRGSIITNKAVAYNMKHIKTDRGDEGWLAVNIIDTNDALKHCNIEKQKVLVAEILKVEASIRILDKYIQQNMLRIEMPVMNMVEAA